MRALSRKISAAVLVAVLLVSVLGITAVSAEGISKKAGAANDIGSGSSSIAAIKENTYKKYSTKYAGTSHPDVTVTVNGKDYIVLDSSFNATDEKLPVAEFEGNDTMGKEVKLEAVVLSDEVTAGWKVNVPEDGLYNISMTYYTFLTYEDTEGEAVVRYTSKGSSVSRALYIDGELPFYDARQFQFSRLWMDETPIKTDEITNNQIRPFQVEKEGWQTAWFRDYLGYYSEPLSFYLTKGEHTIALSPIAESFALASLSLTQYKQPKTYAQIKAEYDAKGYKPVEDNEDTFIKIQAEDPMDKSEPTLYAVADRSSPSCEPYHVSKIRLNTVGGEKWQDQGSWMSWKVNVKQAGLYQIAIKAKQNVNGGANSYRRLSIDGEDFCAETQSIAYGYETSYDMYTVGDGEEAYLVYLSEGEHILRLDVTLGDVSDILQLTEESLTQLNAAYRRILMLTGSAPDLNRDYQFAKVIPDALKILDNEYERLKDIEQLIKDCFDGKNSEQTSVINRMLLILEGMKEDEDTIKERFADFKDNIAALGTWINDMREQPLQVDYIIVCSPDHELPKGDSNFWERLVHEIGAFIASFTEDYDAIGSVKETDGEPVVVWVETGAGNAGNRDNANVLKQMIDTRFTEVYHVGVDLRLVAGGALLPATLAGNGPDVCLTRGSSDAVNYALRGATVNLNQERFEGYDDVIAQFDDSALTPLRFRSGLFGLPETQDFYMMYYRTDILEELGVDPDSLDTWEDIYKLLPILQNKQMNFGMPVPVLGLVGGTLGLYAMLLYQNGGNIYLMSDEYEYDGVSSNLESDVALDAFKMWTDLFVVHRLPNSYDFANRFRSGEVPVALATYSSYNLLSVFAPEIDGLWSFRKVPGTRQADGTVDYTSAGGVTACIMLSTSKNQIRAWKFMSWWVGTEAQALFGREIESMLGSAARYQTANKAAVEQLPWDKKSLDAIMDQWQYVQGIPEVPGSYYMGRYIEFAWKEVINSNSDSNLVLLEYSKKVREEIERKRAEFADKLETDVFDWLNGTTTG